MFTKGEWKAQQQKNLASGKYEWVIEIQQDEVVSRVIATTPYANKYNDHKDNALLISAAPELYGLLDLLRRRGKSQVEDISFWDNLTKALNKAEGKL